MNRPVDLQRRVKREVRLSYKAKNEFLPGIENVLSWSKRNLHSLTQLHWVYELKITCLHSLNEWNVS